MLFCECSFALLICLVHPRPPWHPRLRPPVDSVSFLNLSEVGRLSGQYLLASLNLGMLSAFILSTAQTHWPCDSPPEVRHQPFLTPPIRDNCHLPFCFSGYCDQSSWRNIPNHLTYSCLGTQPSWHWPLMPYPFIPQTCLLQGYIMGTFTNYEKGHLENAPFRISSIFIFLS